MHRTTTPPAPEHRAGRYSLLSIPGRHEASALADSCPECTTLTLPAAVLDDMTGDSIRTNLRATAYRCGCGGAWLCHWTAAGSPAARIRRTVARRGPETSGPT